MRWLGKTQYKVFFSVGLFGLPAVLHASGTVVPVPTFTARVLPVFVPAGPALYAWWTRRKGASPRTGSRSADPVGDLESRSHNEADAELLAANYTQLNEQAMYRDQLLIRANYFSLAVIGVLVSVFLSASPAVRPFVAMLGTVIAYGFWLATESYKGTRDALNEKIRHIEDYQHDEFAVMRTYDLRDRSTVERRSLSSYLIGLQIAATVGWLAIYLVSVIYLGYF